MESNRERRMLVSNPTLPENAERVCVRVRIRVMVRVVV